MVQYPGVAKGLYVASSSGLYGLCNVFLDVHEPVAMSKIWCMHLFCLLLPPY